MNSVEEFKLNTEDNVTIACRRYQNNHSEVVVVAPGFFNSKDQILIKRLCESLIDEYDVIAFDFRGHGKSSGLFTWTSKEPSDLKVVLSYAKERYKKIGLISFSMAAASSIIYLSEHEDIDSFIAIAAVAEIKKINYRFWELDFKNDILYNLGEGGRAKGVRLGQFWLRRESPLDCVSKINKTPILYIHGDADWVIKPLHSQKLFEKTHTTKRLEMIKGGSHAEYLMKFDADKLVRLIKDWLSQTL